MSLAVVFEPKSTKSSLSASTSRMMILWSLGALSWAARSVLLSRVAFYLKKPIRVNWTVKSSRISVVLTFQILCMFIKSANRI